MHLDVINHWLSDAFVRANEIPSVSNVSLHKTLSHHVLNENMSSVKFEGKLNERFMSQRQLSIFRWNGAQWCPIDESSTQKQSIDLSDEQEPIRVAAFNVLADRSSWYIEAAIKSQERFEWLPDGIRQLNPSIIALNEVSVKALRHLQTSPFIRANYFISEHVNEVNEQDNKSPTTNSANGLCNPHGTIILSRLPLVKAFAVGLARSKREAVVVQAVFGRHLVNVCGLHLRSLQMPGVNQARAEQMRDITNALRSLEYPFILMGDLNLHSLSEDSVVIENRLIDAWAQTHFSDKTPFNDGQPGFTFDAVLNTFIVYNSPGEYRQMRLDRILFSSGFPARAISPCTLWANHLIKDGSYLFPSDHFGLSIDLTSHLKSVHDDTTISLGEPDAAAQEILRRNAENNVEQKTARFVLLRRIAGFTSHVGWLGAVALGLK